MKTFAAWTNWNARINFEPRTEHIVVEVMAEASGYAMVRRKGRIPFVVAANDLTGRVRAPKWPA